MGDRLDDDTAGMLAWHVAEIRKACDAVADRLGPEAAATYRAELCGLIVNGTTPDDGPAAAAPPGRHLRASRPPR